MNILQCQDPVTTALTNLDEIRYVAVIAGDHDVMVDAFWPLWPPSRIEECRFSHARHLDCRVMSDAPPLFAALNPCCGEAW